MKNIKKVLFTDIKTCPCTDGGDGVIAGAVIGALLGCLLIILIVWFIAHTIKKHKYKEVKVTDANETK